MFISYWKTIFCLKCSHLFSLTVGMHNSKFTDRYACSAPLSYDMLVSPFPKIPFVPLSNCKKFQIKNMHTNSNLINCSSETGIFLLDGQEHEMWTGFWHSAGQPNFEQTIMEQLQRRILKSLSRSLMNRSRYFFFPFPLA